MSVKYRTEYAKSADREYIQGEQLPWMQNRFKRVVQRISGYTEDTKTEWVRVGSHYVVKEVPYHIPIWVNMTDSEVMATSFVGKDIADAKAIIEQASLFKQAGYEGPLPQGSGRALAVFIKETPEYADCLKRGWTFVFKPKYYDIWALRGPYYLFKSPVRDLDARQFLRLCRMLKKSSHRLADSIKHLIEHPEEVAEAKQLLVMDNLAEGFV